MNAQPDPALTDARTRRRVSRDRSPRPGDCDAGVILALHGDWPEWDTDAGSLQHEQVRPADDMRGDDDEARTTMMRAQLGDWLVIQPPPNSHHVRRGQVIALLHADGSPPYRVRWLDDDSETLIHPPPDARLEHHDGSPGDRPTSSRPSGDPVERTTGANGRS
ncbi:MAG: hypothetical protein ABT15_21165 [Pseudonocardia sp. SCN 73-27]|nr:MAG: hypothetical protein ABS80_04775 [Pseudonocardia sp. SCN 72-51]ODV04475.1 MAG: hypothetical protein ABT15_21165 [Pseudonocardia sp. SCN 73-27]